MNNQYNAHFGMEFRPCKDHSPAKQMGGAHGPIMGPMGPLGPWAPWDHGPMMWRISGVSCRCFRL